MISPFTNPTYLLPPLVAFILSTSLALLIWRISPQKQLSIRLFIALLIAIGVWGLMLFSMRTSLDIEQALFWDRGVPVAILATFVLFYHFTHAYTNSRGQRGILIASYVGLAITAAISPMGLIIERMRVEDYGYAPVIGFGAYPILMSYPLLTAASVRNLLKRYRISPSYEEKNRLIYLFIGAVLLIVGTFLDVFSNLPPAAVKTNIAFSILGSIAILKYNLFDMRTMARRSLAYVITSSVIAIPYVGVMFYVTRTLGVATSPIWMHAIIIVLISIFIRPLYSWSQQRVDRFFYRDRYDYLKALEEFASQTQSITNLKKLCNTVVKLVSGAMQTSCAYLLLPSEEKKGLVIESATCASELKSETILKNSSASTKWLKRHSDIVSVDQFDIHPQLQNLSSAEKKKLEDMGAHLVVPIKTKEGQLSGLLILGQKLSQQPFSLEDKQLLKALSSHVAMAIGNALLYEQVKRSGRALRESEEKLRLTFDSMAEGVAVTDLSANIIEVNKALVDILGYRNKEDLIGNKIHSLVPENDRTEVKKNVEEILAGKYVLSGEVIILKKDGTELDAEISSASITDPTLGVPTGTVTIIEDITQRKKLESEKLELEHKTQIASRLASVGEMASGIAHEINNPLTGVIGFADLLMKKDIPEDVRKYVQTIHDGAQRVAGIVSRLLTFARQEKPSRDSADINGILENTLALRRYELETSNIEIDTQFATDLPRTMADAGQLQQVFLNIIVNAETEMALAHGRGKLTIKTETMDNIIRISFKDNGPGIAKEDLKKIFDPFFTTREVGKGTGLGLSLCHAIIAEHNGQIYAKSKLGSGATFTVELPVVKEGKHLESTGSVADEPENTTKARILVVDDEPTVRQFLSELLTDQGHEVETVDNATDALKMMGSEGYSHILLDIKLPGMSGIELYKRLEEIDKSLVKKVIFITGDVMGVGTKDFLSRTKARYISKPIDVQQLNKLIQGGQK